MAARAPEAAPAELLARVEELSARVEELDDPRARALASELVSAVIAMYGDGLERIVSTLRDARTAGATILDELAQDGAVASLLLIHDLYPVGLRERVDEALQTVRPYMESHGGDVEIVELTETGLLRLALRGSCHGCSASRATLETAINRALQEHCPDLAGIEVGGVLEEGGAVSAISGVALPMAEGALGRAAARLGEDPACLPVIDPSPSPSR